MWRCLVRVTFTMGFPSRCPLKTSSSWQTRTPGHNFFLHVPCSRIVGHTLTSRNSLDFFFRPHYLILFFDTKRTWQWLPRDKVRPKNPIINVDQMEHSRLSIPWQMEPECPKSDCWDFNHSNRYHHYVALTNLTNIPILAAWATGCEHGAGQD